MDANTTTPVERVATESVSAQALARCLQQTSLTLPAADCYESSQTFVEFCREQGIPAEHVFVEIDRGRQIAEHYMAFFPEEQLAYDLSPQNAQRLPEDFDPFIAMRHDPNGDTSPKSHVVYTPEQLREKGWRLGMNNSGWPGLK